MRTLLIAAFTVAALKFSISFAKDSCSHEERRNAVLAAEGAVRAKIIGLQGALDIRGLSGLEEIRIRGAACASDQKHLQQVNLVAERRGDEIHVESLIDDRGWKRRAIARLDLEIEAPDTLPLDIEDSTGPVTVQGTGPLRLDNGTGKVRIEGIDGAVWIRDGTGSVRIENVEGDVELQYGTGGSSIEGVDGDVAVRDGTGSIYIRSVTGAVEIADGTGSVSLSQIEGEVRIK